MGTVTVLTAARMLDIEAESIVSGTVDGFGHLILTNHGGDTFDAGLVLAPNLADASTTVKGIVELATSLETEAGSNTTKAVTPKGFSDAFGIGFDAKIFSALSDVSYASTTSQKGFIETATDVEVNTGTDTHLAVTPEGFMYALTHQRDGGLFDTRYYTEAEIDALFKNPQMGQLPSTVVVGSGSASVTPDCTVLFNGASSVSLNDIFDGIGADAYRVTGVFDTSGAAASISVRKRKAGSDNSATEYSYQDIVGASTSVAAGASTVNGFLVQAGATGTGTTALDMVISRPKSTSARTVLLGMAGVINSTQSIVYTPMQLGPTTTKDGDGLTLIASGGTMSGWIKVVKIS